MRWILAVIILISSSSDCLAANFALEIIQPQPDLTTTNRFYKAYPGLEYNVRAGVIGGAYPFTYALTTYPTGMTIDPETGEISWPNPVEAGSPHSVTMSVTDAESTIATRSWTVTVTTTGFYFVDAVSGLTVANGGTGTFANPWKTIEDWYISKYDSTYQNGFIYWRTGTYTVPALEDGTRLAFVSSNKPKIWLTYPGESPVFDMTSAYLTFYSNGGNNVYVDGIDFTNVENPARKVFDISGTNVVIRNSEMHNTTELAYTNMAHIFLSGGELWAIQDNLFYDSVRSQGIEGYNSSKVLVEDNSFYNLAGGAGEAHGIMPKSNITRWDIRHNSLWNIEDHSIWMGGSNSQLFSNNEIRFNVVKSVASGNALTSDYDGSALFGAHYIYRNTFVGPVYLRFPTASRGPIYLADNVIQSVGLTYSDPATPEEGHLVSSGNLIDVSGIVDVDGLLTAPYAEYLGVTGWQVAAAPDPECDFSHPLLCLTEGSCEAISGLYWCDGTCQVGECPPPSGVVGPASLGGSINVPLTGSQGATIK